MRGGHASQRSVAFQKIDGTDLREIRDNQTRQHVHGLLEIERRGQLLARRGEECGAQLLALGALARDLRVRRLALRFLAAAHRLAGQEAHLASQSRDEQR